MRILFLCEYLLLKIIYTYHYIVINLAKMYFRIFYIKERKLTHLNVFQIYYFRNKFFVVYTSKNLYSKF